ncbi:MAG TPA: hypothetical protein VG737_14235 [Cyclobacteriaceae bacterium]|nr:hypothetical protein [Cyclobacteriaceae bacterium]
MNKRKSNWKLSFGEMIQICGLIATATVLAIRFDMRLERLEVKFDSIDKRLEKTENLLNLDLSWRYLHQSDPARKHLRPLYHPDTRTLELVAVISSDTTVRKQ